MSKKKFDIKDFNRVANSKKTLQGTDICGFTMITPDGAMKSCAVEDFSCDDYFMSAMNNAINSALHYSKQEEKSMTSKKGKKNIDHSYDEAVQYNKF